MFLVCTKIWSGGTLASLLPLPGKQHKRSSRKNRENHDEQQIQSFQWNSTSSFSKVQLAKCPTIQAPVFSPRASIRPDEKRKLSHQLRIVSSTRDPTPKVRYSERLATRPPPDDDHDDHDDDGVEAYDTRTRGLFRVATLVGSATVFSKLLGLVRETILAAVFGVGPVINAFSYSSIIPGFFLTLLGGINGPFHTAVAASLSKRPKEEGRTLVQKLTIIIAMVFGAISVAVFLFSAPLLDALAPGLLIPGFKEGLLTRKLAIIQLKIMAPCAMLAALVGIGFGILSSAGVYGIPSLSPALSSMSVIIGVCIYVSIPRQPLGSLQDAVSAAVHLAAGVTVGAMAQWGLQAIAQHRAGYGLLQFNKGKYENPFVDEGFQEVLSVLVPAAISSGMLHIATYTDLYFSSFIPDAAAALSYANLLAMAPVGILSSSILVPLLPLLSRLSKPSLELQFEERVRQGLLLSMALTSLMTTLMVPLARPIVRVVFERHAFDASASGLVSSLLICYVLGSSAYLARDLLVRVFYVLGDSQTPFWISTAAIFMNALLDWLFVHCAGFGVQGLVAATSLVNFGCALSLLFKLSSNYQGLRLQNWVRPLLFLACSATVAGTITHFSYLLAIRILTTEVAFTTRFLWAADLFSIVVASLAGAVVYLIPLLSFQTTETKAVLSLLRTDV